MVSGWKVVAIIFVCLFLLETSYLVWAMSVGVRAEKDESKCALDDCSPFDSYQYDPYSRTCICYKDGVVGMRTSYT